MDSAYTPIRGPYVKHAFAKSVHKGEDAWAQNRDVRVNNSKPGEGGVMMDFFGVFDGHGGKQAAAFASKHLLPALVEALPAATNSAAEPGPPPEDIAACADIPIGDRALWQAQDSLVAGLPAALQAAFPAVQDAFFQKAKVSGSTATVAALVGWELLIANVGDSCAYLDTGHEVLQVSGNHRLDDNAAERARVKAAGCEVGASLLEGKPVGPLRVWPGGLAMSRTLGDHAAGEQVSATPEVRQVTLPAAGARVILASDGLWDAVHAKSAAHHVRGLPATKAAADLVNLALRAKGLRDDITVLVIDALPDAELRVPPLLHRKASGPQARPPPQVAEALARTEGGGSSPLLASLLSGEGTPPNAVPVLKPLEQPDTWLAAWHRSTWERRRASVQATYRLLLAPASPSGSLGSSMQSAGTGVRAGDLVATLDTAGMDDGLEAASEGTEAPSAADLFEFDPEEAQDAAADAPATHWETVPSKLKGKRHAGQDALARAASADAELTVSPRKEPRPATLPAPAGDALEGAPADPPGLLHGCEGRGVQGPGNRVPHSRRRGGRGRRDADKDGVQRPARWDQQGTNGASGGRQQLFPDPGHDRGRGHAPHNASPGLQIPGPGPVPARSNAGGGSAGARGFSGGDGLAVERPQGRRGRRGTRPLGPVLSCPRPLPRSYGALVRSAADGPPPGVGPSVGNGPCPPPSAFHATSIQFGDFAPGPVAMLQASGGAVRLAGAAHAQVPARHGGSAQHGRGQVPGRGRQQLSARQEVGGSHQLPVSNGMYKQLSD